MGIDFPDWLIFLIFGRILRSFFKSFKKALKILAHVVRILSITNFSDQQKNAVSPGLITPNQQT